MSETGRTVEPELPDSAFHPLRVARTIAETQDTCSLELDVPPEFAQHFRYLPGQFLTLRVPSERTGSVGRCYSLSSAPHEDGPLKVTVKRVHEGYGSNWLCDNARAGMMIDALPPAGRFTPKSLDHDFLLFAGGSGITPMMSIMKSVLAEGKGEIALIYANRDEQSIIFADELESLTNRYPERVTIRHLLESAAGLPSVDQLADLASPWREREAYVCGPGGFMDVVAAALNNIGADRRRVHIEKFISLSRSPFEVEENSGSVNDADHDDADGLPASLDVEIDGSKHQFSWPRGKLLLDVLLENGIRAPYSCREGACSSCVCQVVSGEVEMMNNDVLESDDLNDGFVLACQSIPVTDVVSVRYD